MVFKILSSDLLISDIIVHADQNPAAAALIEELKTKRAQELNLPNLPDKIAIGEEDFKRFQQAIPPGTVTPVPGGSSANVLTTMSKLLGKDNLEINFVGVVGDDPTYHSGDIIRKSLDEAGIRLVPPPESLPKDPPARNAVSFVVVYPDGHRSIATYPGNAKEILESSHITQEMVDNSDAVFVQGSLYEKMPHIAQELVGNHEEHSDETDLANAMIGKSWHTRNGNGGHRKELWFAAPTQAIFHENNGDTDHRKRFPMASANVVLSNEPELKRLFDKAHTRDALDALRDQFNQHVLWPGTRQVGFVTAGASGAFLVNKKLRTPEFAKALDVPHIVNDLGAGDTAFAGFLTGRVLGMTMNESAELAMALAGAKLQVDGPRLDNPREALHAIEMKLPKPMRGDKSIVEKFETRLKLWLANQAHGTETTASIA